MCVVVAPLAARRRAPAGGRLLVVACMPATENVMAFPERTAHEFFEQASVHIGDKTHMFRRLRSLDDDVCPVFEHGDLEKIVRLRVEDISRDADGVTWLHCSASSARANCRRTSPARCPAG